MRIFLIIVSCIVLLSACVETKTKRKVSMEDIENAYLEKGKAIAASTFSILGSTLQTEMKKGGVQNAVKYCNLAASPMVDSLMQVHQANIRRTSLKIRNPKNKPTDIERVQLELFQKQHEAGTALKPTYQKSGNQVSFYAPIYVMELCQNCHGKKGAGLKEEDFAFIKDLYPADKAVSYHTGDLRGMWSITFVDNL